MIDDVLGVRRIADPSISWSQFLEDLKSRKLYAGQQSATVNLTTLLGGFAKFGGNEAQIKAAARFRSLHDRAQLGGSKAIDPGIEAVDGGAANPEAIFEIGADARRALLRLQAHLTKPEYARMEYVIIGDNGPTAYARQWLGQRCPDGKAIKAGKAEVCAIVDKMARHFGYAI